MTATTAFSLLPRSLRARLFLILLGTVSTRFPGAELAFALRALRVKPATLLRSE